MFSLGQPTINKLWNTRQAQESFMKWAGVSGSFYDYLKNNWIKNILIKPEVAVDAEAKENAAQEAKEAAQSIIDFTSGWNKA
ncbi:MAG TPA: hypothetical protein ENK64_02100, partial [Flavobacteriales bacterium]|nr:hypothetical protein [Flavobacteriales bacterium]